jgi:hypothetical protein
MNNKQELIHNPPPPTVGEWVTLRFANGESCEVLVESVSESRMTIRSEGDSFEFEPTDVPFDLSDTSMGPVVGTFKMWRPVGFPNCSPCMVKKSQGGRP